MTSLIEIIIVNTHMLLLFYLFNGVPGLELGAECSAEVTVAP